MRTRDEIIKTIKLHYTDSNKMVTIKTTGGTINLPTDEARVLAQRLRGFMKKKVPALQQAIRKIKAPQDFDDLCKRATQMHNKPTRNEHAMCVRLLKAGINFEAQVPIGWYIADFLFIEKMLILELDGPQHARH